MWTRQSQGEESAVGVQGGQCHARAALGGQTPRYRLGRALRQGGGHGAGGGCLDFGGYIAENYLALQDYLQLPVTDLVKLALNAAEISWLPPARKAALVAEITQYAAAAG